MAEAAPLPADDLVLPFEIKPLGVRGRLVRLGPAVDDILHRHSYPAPVSALLAEAVALAAILGAMLKFDGKFILQTKTDGPVDMIVADYVAPGKVRGYARFDAARVAALKTPSQASLLGTGYLAMTVDQGPDMERYQGIVPLDGADLTAAAHSYFEKSEQIPTRLRMAAGPLIQRGNKGEAWRAGAIKVQHLPREGGSSPLPSHSGDAPEGADVAPQENDDWVKARLLLDTVEAHELLDPQLSAEQLLYRLYHEDGVTAYPATHLERYCSCSQDSITRMLARFPAEDRADMVTDGEIAVTCEFCSTTYKVKPGDLAP
ncbi:Hsp33 family molecular chaperone [Aestuariivirga litoralis]|uniref:Hsp33 family molecular chaperone n=1 Tax=Aestuariivirga litoralis TaxID=2650924 RepID=A0A2W2AVR9_9HYPH|nr:Hsp33 family molecular chaperone [Aestuariivirga litoralis]PZF76710.1 Hsp33 family molecular chaperone [Aestuariivirga litoralis]